MNNCLANCLRLSPRWAALAKVGSLALLFLLVGLARSVAGAEKDPFPKLRVEKKPSEKTGTALVTINGKNKVLARRAIQAWPIMEGEKALVIVAAQEKAYGTFLRYGI